MTELAELIDEVSKMSDPIDLDLVRAFQASTLAQPVADEFFRTVVAEGARLPLGIWRAVLKEVAAYDDFTELSQIAAPTILFWGEHDNFSTYEQQQELASEVPGAELRVYAGAGHSLHWEEPQALRQRPRQCRADARAGPRRPSSAQGPDECLEIFSDASPGTRRGAMRSGGPPPGQP